MDALDSGFVYTELLKIEPIDGAKYKILCHCNREYFLVLQTTNRSQTIYEYAHTYDKPRFFKTFPLHPKIVSASLSNKRDKVIITFYSLHNGFVRQWLYHVMCYTKGDIETEFPLSSISNTYPRVDFLKNQNRYYFWNGTSFELWDLTISSDDVLHKRIFKSSRDVSWCGAQKNKFLEYIIIDPMQNEYILSSNYENPRVYQLPVLKKTPFSFKHILGNNYQDVIVFVNASDYNVFFPNAAMLLRVPSINQRTDGDGRRLTDTEIMKMMVLENDILIIVAQQKSSTTLACTMIDAEGAPRTFFSFTLKNGCKDSHMCSVSDTLLEAVDSEMGTYSRLDFDYSLLVPLRPDLFYVLSHFSALRSGNNSTIFKYVTYENFQYHWASTIFDEFILCLLREDLGRFCSTFCQMDKSMSSIFSKVGTPIPQIKHYKKHRNIGSLVRSLQAEEGVDFGRIKAKIPAIVSSLSNKSYDDDQMFFVCNGLFVESLWVDPEVKALSQFIQYVYPRLFQQTSVMWVHRRIAQFEVVFVSRDASVCGRDHDDNTDAIWWRTRCVHHVQKPEAPWSPSQSPISGLRSVIEEFAGHNGETNFSVLTFYQSALGSLFKSPLAT